MRQAEDKIFSCLIGCIVTAILLIILFFGMSPFFGGYHYSIGYREGVVQKFSTKGLLWKTREGEMATAAFRGDSTASNVFAFSVTDPEVVREISRLHCSQPVRLHYREVLVPMPWVGNATAIITKVERLP